MVVVSEILLLFSRATGGRRENNARMKAARPLCVEHATGPQPPVEHSVYVAGKFHFHRNTYLLAAREGCVP